MSQMNVDTLASANGLGSPAVTGGEFSRARFNLNGTGTIAARDSFNCSSFVDNGTGDYTANFTTAFPNADYSVASAGTDATNTNSTGFGIATPPAVGSFRARTFQPGVYGDSTYVSVIFVGDRP
jgi:hypothetical protein